MVELCAALQAAARALPPARLSEEQMQFVAAEDEGSEVLVAAAGSGKTLCLLQRFEAYLRRLPLESHLQIVSFSKSAAEHFQAVFEQRWPAPAPRVARTLHSWAKHHVLARRGICEERVSLLLPAATALLKEDAELLRAVATGLRLLVDEAQDCCAEQFELLRVLHSGGAAVCVVGDPRQSIFGFMGAKPQLFAQLPWRRRELLVNRRSTRAIIELANGISALDAAAPQQPAAAAPQGERPSVHFARSAQYYHLEVLRPLLDVTRPAPACVLARTNAEVDRLHENLWALGFHTLALGAAGSLPAPLAEEASLVHVRTVHSCKGHEYDTVLLAVQGFDSSDKAEEAFAALQPWEREESVRLVYVAATRARRRLHVIVLGAHPPLWWARVAATCAPLLRICGKPATLAPRREEPRAHQTSLREFCARHSAVDSLLTYAPRARAVRSDAGDTPRCGQLADEAILLGQARAPLSARLLALRGDKLRAAVARFVYQAAVAPHAARHKAAAALDFLDRVPLLPGQLADIERLVLEDQSLARVLPPAVALVLETGDASHLPALRAMLAPAQRRLSGSEQGNPAFALTSGSAFLELVRPGPFRIGAPTSSTVKRVVARLRKGGGAAQLFRPRALLDAAALEHTRELLARGTSDFLQNASAHATACAACLTELCAGKERRALPYLGASSAQLHLPLADCFPGPEELQALAEQASRLRGALRAWHSAPRPSLDLRVALRAEGAPPLQANVDIFFNDTRSTSIFLVDCATLDDEVQALLAGEAAQRGGRVVLVCLASAQAFVYDVAPHEGLAAAATRLGLQG
jgi:hypothetical protein